MKYSVLIIDDEKELAESTSEYFNMMGISSKYVLTSQEALDFFKDKKEQVFKLVAGDPLTYNDGYLCTNDNVVIVALSKQQRDELGNWSEKGYNVHSARVNFIVAWKGKNDDKETAVVLPELTLRKTD